MVLTKAPYNRGVKMFKFLKMLWQNQRGEEIAGDAPGDTGVADPAVDTGLDESGQAGEAPVIPATPKFGEFGDDPAEAAGKLFEAYQKTQGEFTNFKTKSGLTERNLGSLRKALESSGIRAIDSDDGQIRLEAIQKAERKSRFNEEHGKLFEPKILESMRLLVQDIFDEQYEGRERTTSEQRQKMQQFVAEKSQIEQDMMEDYPMLDGKFKDGKPTNPNFNKALYDRATEIWETEFQKNPLKQYSAARKAAKELNIIPGMIQAAKKEGVAIGMAGKKILSPVGGAGAPAGSGSFKKLSQAEYLALSSDDRLKYDQSVINQRK